MGDRSFERLGAIAGLTATVAVGAGVLLDTVVGADAPVVRSAALWWVSYLVFVLALLIDAGVVRQPGWLTDRLLLAVQVSAAAVAYLATPQYGWTAVLLVVTAATSAFTLSERGCAALVAGQTVLVGVSQLTLDLSGGDVVLAALVYGCFQAFAVLMVRSVLREATARSELATAHAELRASSALLSGSSRTAERLRIARELHDLVGHQLTALSLELEVATHQEDAAARAHVQRARDTAKSLLGDVRSAVGELRAESAGLTAPLHALVDGLPGPTVELRVVEETAVDENHALAVVRCVQEIVTNTLRHADARHLWITVRATGNEVHVEARDDGRGVAVLRPGNGLMGVRERLQQLGGEVQLDSGEGRGFRVAARVPAT